MSLAVEMDNGIDTGNNSLLEAVESGSIETVRFLLKRGINPNRCNPQGQNAAMMAAKSGNEELLRILVPLLDKSSNMINHQDKEGCSLLMIGASNGMEAKTALYLWEQGAEIGLVNLKGQNLFILAALSCNVSFVDFLLPRRGKLSLSAVDNLEKTALCYCVTNKHSGVGRRLLVSGADPNHTLAWAAKQNNITVFNRLVDWMESDGIKIAHTHESVEAILTAAIQINNIEMFTILLKLGAKPFNLILKALKENDRATLGFFSEFNSSVQKVLDEPDDNGQSLLMLAASSGEISRVKAVLALGANPYINQFVGDIAQPTPLKLAILGDQKDVVIAIIKAMCKLPRLPTALCSIVTEGLALAIVNNKANSVRALLQCIDHTKGYSWGKAFKKFRNENGNTIYHLFASSKKEILNHLAHYANNLIKVFEANSLTNDAGQTALDFLKQTAPDACLSYDATTHSFKGTLVKDGEYFLTLHNDTKLSTYGELKYSSLAGSSKDQGPLPPNEIAPSLLFVSPTVSRKKASNTMVESDKVDEPRSSFGPAS